MNKVIQVLEQMASDSSLQNKTDIETLLTTAKIKTGQSEAIIAKNVVSLERQLDICPDIICFLVPAEDDDKDSETDEDQARTQSVVNG
ncbi:hypothetical protein [Colwellia psychrerythraea]|uniref:Uncharacterized protein n=1 Tax=Colwellia psychrerythraea TaxID=28229 RepID=A0A099KI88_COLPS|nr:hypothetical protein [Colwellia psychrerythraea]KGJ89692.1 hypothetical protein GAB14E_3853 [Colwellia psychrerythraea]